MIYNTEQDSDWSEEEKERKLEWLHAQLRKYQQGKYTPPAAQDPTRYCRKERRREKGGNDMKGRIQ